MGHFRRCCDSAANIVYSYTQTNPCYKPRAQRSTQGANYRLAGALAGRAKRAEAALPPSPSPSRSVVKDVAVVVVVVIVVLSGDGALQLVGRLERKVDRTCDRGERAVSISRTPARRRARVPRSPRAPRSPPPGGAARLSHP